MRVRMIRFGGVIGNNVHLQAGNEYDVPEDLARAIASDGRGIIVAEVRPKENAAKRIGRPPARTK
jgi:hypothetical protein